MSIQQDSGKVELKRVLNLFDSSMIIIGTTIASGIFLVPTVVAGHIKYSIPTIIGWMLGGIITLFGGLSLAELGVLYPRAGGMFVYLKEAYGKFWGFLYGWTLFTVIQTASIAAVAVVFATYLGHFVELSRYSIVGIAIISIVFLSIVNCFGVKLGAKIQNFFSVLKISAIIVLIFLTFSKQLGATYSNFFPLFPENNTFPFLAAFGLSMVYILFTYDGWIHINYIAGEVKNPSRNIPVSLIVSIMIITGIYLLANIAYIKVLSIQEIANSERVAADVAEKIIGSYGGALISIMVIVATFGANNGMILAGPRVYYAMAEDQLFFSFLSKINKRYHTPVNSILIQGLWSSVLVLSGSYEQLLTYVIFTSFLFYGMSSFGVILLRRKRPDLKREYKTWGYPYTPVVFILFSAALVLNTIASNPRDSLIGIFIMFLGIPAYYYWKTKKIV
ncbi:MAG: amino acid permease [Acidobacteriota bacterium]